MATRVAKKDNWKFPKIPVHNVYQRKRFSFFPKWTLIDFESPIRVMSGSEFTSLDLLPSTLVKRFSKKKHKLVHLGLVQVAISPLERDGLDAPVIVCLRDGRQSNFKDSWLAVVETNMSKGPFYFNCFPSFSIPIADIASCEAALNLRIKSTGTPLALTVRVVCKAMVDLNAKYLKDPVFGKTDYFHAKSATPTTTLWDNVELEDQDEVRAQKLQQHLTHHFQSCA